MLRLAALTGLTVSMVLGQSTHSARHRTLARHPRIAHNLRCIHRYEGRWDDPYSPYWGGLQMDLTFQQTYGPSFLRRWGTADHWPPWAQLTAGVRAVLVRGYSPWPVSRTYCGV
jgi:hypothetical protein